jgi:flagellar protein FlaG
MIAAFSLAPRVPEEQGGYMEISGIRAPDLALESTAASNAAKLERQDKAAQQELIRAVKSVNASGVLANNQEMTFSVDRETKRTVVRVVDRETDEVLLQIPDEQVLRMAQKLPKS